MQEGNYSEVKLKNVLAGTESILDVQGQYVG